ncbi:MAG: O-antigen ligase family protein [Bacteroidota bacterium]
MTLKKIYTWLFFIGLFFIPFNDFKGLSFMGEYKDESAAFFLLPAFLVLLASGKVNVPVKSPYFKLLLVFLAWCIVATLINFPTVLQNYFKQTSGISRFVRQYISLLISTFIFFLVYWNVIIAMTTKEILLKIRKVLLCSLVFASVYGFFETLVVVFHINAARHLLSIFDYFPFLDVIYHANRISSIAFEPPFLAIYLITVAGWMFSYVLTESSRLKFIPMVLVIILTYFSGSRTALLVIFIQLAIFFSILYRSKKYRQYIIYISMFAAVGIIAVLAINAEKIIYSVEKKLESLNFSGNLKTDVSNKSRFGMQYASLQVFKENPVTGVGFGQQSYHSRFHYPLWATRDNYEFVIFYRNQAEKSFPPGYNIYTRLLAETGFIGTGLFIAFAGLLWLRARQLLKTATGDKKILALILLISFTGFCINWLQVDTFRIYGFWICAAILIKISPQANNETDEQNSTPDTAL